MVLQHCPPDVEAEIKNQSTWNAGQEDQNMVTLILMIRDITHYTREIKKGVMAIVECAVEMHTNVQK